MGLYSTEDFCEETDVNNETSGAQENASDRPKKPLPFFLEAAEHIENAGYKSGWINMNVDVCDPHTHFIKPKNRYGYKSGCPHFQGIWLSGGFSSLKCAVCPTPVPGLHLELTCSKDYAQCPFYNGESIENHDVR